jgi:Regulator of chromosome condensation (RCC1) repeat
MVCVLYFIKSNPDLLHGVMKKAVAYEGYERRDVFPALIKWPFIFCLLLVTHPSLADQVSYSTNTASDAYMPWTNSLQFPQFNQPFTRLENVTYSASGTATAYVNVRNGTSGNDYVTAIGTNNLTFTKPSGSTLVVLNFSTEGSAVVIGHQSKSILATADTNVSGSLPAGEISSYIGSGTANFQVSAPAGTISVTAPKSTVLNKLFWGSAGLTLTYSFTPIGLTQQDPILPTSSTSSNSVFTEVPSGRWFGQAATAAIRFDMTTPGAAFTDILGFPTGFQTPFKVSANGVDLGQFAPGQTLAFGGAGVQSFTVYGVIPGFPIQLGFTTTNASFTMTPVVVLPAIVVWGNAYGTTPSDLQSVAAIGTGWYHSFARRGDGSAVLWGYNNYNDTVIPQSVTDMVAMAGGQDHTIVLHGNGTVDAWGEDFYGQCDLQAGLGNIVAVAAGTFNSYVLTANGYVYGWGDDTYGQASQVYDLYNIISISSLVNHGLALRSDGGVLGWGDDSYGQTDIPPGLGAVVAVAAGNGDSMVLRSDGTVVVWGNNSHGQTNVPTGLSNVVAIAAGFYHCLALRNDGTVVAWGWNNQQQTNVPTGLSNVVAIAAGGYQSIALVGSGLAAPTLQITNCHGSNGAISFQVPTVRGKTYYFQHQDSLAGPWWTPSLPVPGDGMMKTLTDSSTATPQRFYRVWQKP